MDSEGRFIGMGYVAKVSLIDAFLPVRAKTKAPAKDEATPPPSAISTGTPDDAKVE